VKCNIIEVYDTFSNTVIKNVILLQDGQNLKDCIWFIINILPTCDLESG